MVIMLLVSLLLVYILICLYYAPRNAKFFAKMLVDFFPIFHKFALHAFPFFIFGVFAAYLIGIAIFVAIFILLTCEESYVTMHNSVRAMNSAQMIKVLIMGLLASITTYVCSQTKSNSSKPREEIYTQQCYEWTFLMAVPLVVLLW